MRVTVTQTTIGTISFLFFVFIGISGAWCFYNLESPSIWIGWVALSGSIAGFIISFYNERIMIQINEWGIYDRRLGVGTIIWDDIADVQLFLDQDHRYICFELKNPDHYLERLNGAKRAKVAHSHSLGFKKFNVDIGAVDINVMQLKKIIDRHVRRNA